MASHPRTIRIPPSLERELSRELARRGVKEWSAGIVDLLTESVRMRRVPGIIFVDGRTGRRPMIAGSGVEVWEVIATWKACGQDEAKLRRAYHWLSETQLRAALNYYDLYRDEIDQRLAVEESWTLERLRREYPFTALKPRLVRKRR
jgi:uncharacterized protein (DUF433 family)